MLKDEQYLKIARDYFSEPDERHYLFAKDICRAVTSTQPAPSPASQEEKTCPNCNGSGLEADYVGLEMRCVGVECSICKGKGVIARPEPPIPVYAGDGNIEWIEADPAPLPASHDYDMDAHMDAQGGMGAYDPPAPLPAPAREERAVDPSQIREQSGTVRRLDSRFYCTRNGKLYVRWEYAGGPDQCKHGYARCFACPDCEAAKPFVETDKDALIVELRGALEEAHGAVIVLEHERADDVTGKHYADLSVRVKAALEKTNGK